MNLINEDNTLHELRFLKRLGRWSEVRGLSRRDLLQRYMLALTRRVRWDGIDVGRVRAFAAMELHALGD